jgi:hypothetical protein
MLEEFPVSVARFDKPLEVFSQTFLVDYPSRDRWLSYPEALLPSEGLNSTLMGLV